MSNYKQLKSNPEYNISLVDIMSFVTRTNKAKYLELFCKLYKNKKTPSKKTNDYATTLASNFDLPKQEVDTLTSFGTYIHYLITENMSEEIKLFQKFFNLNERGLIDKNDVTSYSSIDELKVEVSKSESKFIEKEMEKQVHKVIDDEEWLMLRPLTFESSKKYGSDTKWCTTYHDRTYFDKYTKNGILMYMINKQSGVKVAVYKSIKHKENTNGNLIQLGEVAKEFSFWDQKDVRVDSMESGLPDYVKSSIMEEIKNNPLTNLEVYAKRNKIKVPNEEDYFTKKTRSIGMSETTTDNPFIAQRLSGEEPLPGRELRHDNGEAIPVGEARRRVRRLMGLEEQWLTGYEPEDRGELSQAISNIVSGLEINRQELQENWETERINEANEEVESEFMSEMRQLEEQHQIEQYSEEFLREMNLRSENEIHDGIVTAMPMVEETESEDEEFEIGVDSDEEDDFVIEMEERFGQQNDMVATINFGDTIRTVQENNNEVTEQPQIQVQVRRR